MATDADSPVELLDSLYDLQHDLGKHIRLPVALLPEDAEPSAVRQAIGAALRRTGQHQGKPKGAKIIWREFCAQHATQLEMYSTWSGLVEAVSTAIAWEDALDQTERDIPRETVLRDFTSLARAIDRMIDEVEDAA